MQRQWVNIYPLIKDFSLPEDSNKEIEVVSTWISADCIRGIEFWIDKKSDTYTISIYRNDNTADSHLSFSNPKEAWKRWKLIQSALEIKSIGGKSRRKVISESFPLGEDDIDEEALENNLDDELPLIIEPPGK